MGTNAEKHQVIFQVYTKGKWLDYCREPSPSTHQSLSNRWGKEQCEILQARERAPFRFIVEHWN